MNDSNGDKRLVVNVETCVKMLNISRATAYSLVSQGRLPALRISDRRIVIPMKAIDDLIASATIRQP